MRLFVCLCFSSSISPPATPKQRSSLTPLHLPTWFAKPATLSPLEAARHGWRNSNADELACAACSRTLNCVRPDDAASDFDAQQAQQLLDGHGPLCPWRGNPASADYALPDASDAAFSARLASLAALPAHLAGALPPHPPVDTTGHGPAAIALAATGWQLSGPVVSCALCGAAAPAETISVVHCDERAQAPTDAAADAHAAEPEVATQPHVGDVSFDCRRQHRHFCPWAAPAGPAAAPPSYLCGSLAAAAIRRLLK
eukprot:m.202621 g.202621  ORF g.202621 m.202621 type:complete len:256 (+) comp15514_c0_seq7:1688-2455(+)